MTTPVQYVSVTQPVGQAIERVKLILFRPFDLGKWFAIGVCAWLACLGESGYRFNTGGNFNSGSNKSSGSAQHSLEEAKSWLVENISWLLPLVVTLIVLGIALWVLILWLNSRGKFMFLHCVALNRADVTAPWRKYSREANSLFRFRIALWFCSMLLLLPVLAWAALTGLAIARQGAPLAVDIIALIVAFLGFFVFACAFGIVRKFTYDFVVPIQFLRGTTCLAAWREALDLIGEHLFEFILYLLFSIVLSMGIGLLVIAVMLLTCCIACCLLAIPFIGTVALLPLLIFQRAFSAYYLAQFGPAYNVFAAPERPNPT